MVSSVNYQAGGQLPYFSSPISYQRGRGFGSILRNLFRSVVPFFNKPVVKEGIRTLGRAAATSFLDAGQRALNEEGTSFSDALKTASRDQAQILMKKAHSKLTGQGRRGRKRKIITRKKKTVPRRKAKVSRKRVTPESRRVRSRDIFSE